MSLKASIILATFDWPEALAMVLAALQTQTEKSFEVMIADDGSDEKTRKIIEEYKRFYPIQHFWQEHKGFRKSRILNQAIMAAEGETLIFLDGDCVPHKDFVREHVRIQDPEHYVCGRRIDLSKEYTAQLGTKEILAGRLNGESFMDYARLFLDSLKENGSKPFHRSYVVRTPLIRKICGMDKVVDLKGCNFSVSRNHMMAIDGFDESYEGYGREDTDVEIRLQNLGLKIKSAKNLCLQFHLWHEPRAFTPANEDLLESARTTKRVKAIKGISKSL